MEEKKGFDQAQVASVNTVEVKSFNAFSFYLLLLINSFAFNPFFLILPDVFSNNTPIPFL